MNVDCEPSQTKPAADSGAEANGSESFLHSLSIRVEYYRSLEYSLQWRTPMYPRRSSRTSKPSWRSSQRSPSPDEEAIQRKFRGRRQRKAEAGDGVVNAHEGSNRDILDIINDTHNEAKHAAEEEEGTCVEVADKGVDESDEDCGSGTSSIASGPSLLHLATPKNWRPSQDLCSACRKLCQRVKRMKAPIKDKLLDNDPKSLTCDQWVLIKKWTPKRLPNTPGKLVTHVQLVQKRLRVQKGVKRSGKYVEEEHQPSACSRQHVFLQRNLRRCVRVSVRKERTKTKRGKRRRDDSQGSRVAKQKRLRSNSSRQRVGNSLHPAAGHGSSPGLESCSDHDTSSQADAAPTVEAAPSAAAPKTSKPRAPPPRQKTPKKMRGFRDLLAQLRGNNSMIVKETR